MNNGDGNEMTNESGNTRHTMSRPITPLSLETPPPCFSLDEDRAFEPYHPPYEPDQAEPSEFERVELGDREWAVLREEAQRKAEADELSGLREMEQAAHRMRTIGYGGIDGERAHSRASRRSVGVAVGPVPEAAKSRRHSFAPGQPQQVHGHSQVASGTSRRSEVMHDTSRRSDVMHDQEDVFHEGHREGRRSGSRQSGHDSYPTAYGTRSHPFQNHPQSHSYSHSHSQSSHARRPQHQYVEVPAHSRTASRAHELLDLRDDDEFGDYTHQIEDDNVWTEGDFELLSADRVRFRIPSYYLFASSAIFRETSGEVGVDSGVRLPSRRYIHFTDDGESAAVLRLFLEFVVYAKLEVPEDGTTLVGLATVKDLVTFMKKWDCIGTLQLFLVCLREAGRSPSTISPLAMFIAGATAGDAFTCSVALEITDWSWRMMDRHNLPAAPDANVFDPHHMPVTVWQLIPPMYTWALTTAWTGTDDHLKENRTNRRHRASASERDTTSRPESVLSRKARAWQQWL